MIHLKGSRKYQTLPALCNHTVISIHFLKLSPINAELTLPFYVHQYIFVSSAIDTVTVVTLKTSSCVSVIHFINRQISPFSCCLLCE